MTKTSTGVSDLRALDILACARMSMKPKQKTLRCEFTSACWAEVRFGFQLGFADYPLFRQ
jgi:hypothetical protein